LNAAAAVFTETPSPCARSQERARSLLNQGLFYFDCFLNMRDERAKPLMAKFDELLRHHATLREVFGLV